MVKFKLDPKNPPRLSEGERTRLHAMSAAEIEAGAAADADNPPLTAEELLLMKGAKLVKTTRALTGLPQAKFAATYQINPHRLRDLERGRTQPDSALSAYLKVIAKDPDYVASLLKG
jgi:putative transcriptional regulator